MPHIKVRDVQQWVLEVSGSQMRLFLNGQNFARWVGGLEFCGDLTGVERPTIAFSLCSPLLEPSEFPSCGLSQERKVQWPQVETRGFVVLQCCHDWSRLIGMVQSAS